MIRERKRRTAVPRKRCMIEVEVKLKICDRNRITQKLTTLDFRMGNQKKETDIYFDNAEGNFRKEDKALRIRQCENLTTKESICYMTYKGPKLDHISMTRKEVELQIEDAQIGKEMLENLGFMSVHPVIKLRQYFHKENVTACLDQVEGLGDFMELEVIVADEAEKEEALGRIIELLHILGYCKEDIIRTSYLSMLERK